MEKTYDSWSLFLLESSRHCEWIISRTSSTVNNSSFADRFLQLRQFSKQLTSAVRQVADITGENLQYD